MLQELKQAFEVTSQQSASSKVLAEKQKIDLQKAMGLVVKQKKEIQDKSEQIDSLNKHATDIKQSMEVMGPPLSFTFFLQPTVLAVFFCILIYPEAKGRHRAPRSHGKNSWKLSDRRLLEAGCILN